MKQTSFSELSFSDFATSQFVPATWNCDSRKDSEAGRHCSQLVGAKTNMDVARAIVPIMSILEMAKSFYGNQLPHLKLRYTVTNTWKQFSYAEIYHQVFRSTSLQIPRDVCISRCRHLQPIDPRECPSEVRGQALDLSIRTSCRTLPLRCLRFALWWQLRWLVPAVTPPKLRAWSRTPKKNNIYIHIYIYTYIYVYTYISTYTLHSRYGCGYRQRSPNLS
jgi:hypothetical protein